MSESYKAIILLNYIPGLQQVKDAIKYDKETLTPNIVIDSLKSK